MSNLQVNKVDLSLDDIIKLNKKQRQPQVQNRRGNGRIQGRAGSRSRGVRGRNSPGSTSSSGTSQLNRKRAGSGSTRGVIRGQLARRRNLRGKVGYRGSVQRGGSVSSQGEIVSHNAATNQKNTSGGFYFRGIRRYRGGRRGGLQGRGGSAVSQGILQRGVQRRSQGSLNRMSLKQKRQMAIQTLRQARRTIVQLDQQTARQNFVNANRGIVQQNQRLLAKKNRGMYSSSVSLASVSSHNSSASSGRRLQGTRITAFSPSRSQQSLGGQQRMRSMSQSPVGSLNANTLTISIDNTSPGRTDLNAYQVNASVTRQRQKRRQWRRQKSNSSFDSLDLSIGATPSFSHQLSKLKPTVSTTYVFQKRVFSSGSTSFSLNDRFSASAAEDKAGRKVFL